MDPVPQKLLSQIASKVYVKIQQLSHRESRYKMKLTKESINLVLSVYENVTEGRELSTVELSLEVSITPENATLKQSKGK